MCQRRARSRGFQTHAVRYHSPKRRLQWDPHVGFGIISDDLVRVDICYLSRWCGQLFHCCSCGLDVSARGRLPPRRRTCVADIKRIAQLDDNASVPSAKELAARVLTTVYLSSENSSNETRVRSKTLADEVGSSHLDVKIDAVVAAIIAFFVTITRRTTKF